jgi:hypothetical protein
MRYDKINQATVSFNLFSHGDPFTNFVVCNRSTTDGKKITEILTPHGVMTLHEIDLAMYKGILREAITDHWKWCLPVINAQYGVLETTVTLGKIFSGTEKEFLSTHHFDDMKEQSVADIRKQANEILTSTE